MAEKYIFPALILYTGIYFGGKTLSASQTPKPTK
jgi:hypothetical protein